MTDPSVLTIILNFRTPELTLKALDAALREMAGIRGEILVVDNGSGDDSCEVLTRGIEGLANPAVPVRFKASARNGGFGAGNNFGMHAGLSDGTQPDFYYILNSDAFPQKGAIRNLIAHMQTHRHCGIAGSAIRGVDGEPLSQSLSVQLILSGLSSTKGFINNSSQELVAKLNHRRRLGHQRKTVRKTHPSRPSKDPRHLAGGSPQLPTS